MRLLLYTMVSDYFEVYDEADEIDRLSFLASEMEYLKATATLFNGSKILDELDNE